MGRKKAGQSVALEAPFPWFGGKSRVAHIVWRYFGNVPNYVEPFFGSGAVMLGRPNFDYKNPQTETVNDLDGFISNAWRSIKYKPEETSKHADWPVNENDLHARHAWLRGQRKTLTRKLEGDPEFCDPLIAGWWLWGMACWIGGNFCGQERTGPWTVVEIDGVKQLMKVDVGDGVNRSRPGCGHARGVERKSPSIENAGVSVNRKDIPGMERGIPSLTGSQGIVGGKRPRPHLSGERTINRSMVHLSGAQGLNRSLVCLGGGRAVLRKEWDGQAAVTEWFQALSRRLRRVRVCCGGWDRILGPSPTYYQGLSGIFLDPPYSAEADRDTVYATDDLDVAHKVREWCIENGENNLLRICLCGYDGEHKMPKNWTEVAWKATGGYGNQGDKRGRANANRERLWFSPACLKPSSKKSVSLLEG